MSQSVDTVFIPDLSTAVISQLRITHDGSPANGTAANTASATVLDANGNPISGAPVTWSSHSEKVRFSPVTGTTDVNGKVSVNFTDTVAESPVIKATLDNGSNKTQSSSFVADIKIVLIAGDDNAPADGHAQNTMIVTVKDGKGNPKPGEKVSWLSSIPEVTFVGGGQSITDVNGAATIALTSSSGHGETTSITATLDDGSRSNAVTSTFLAINVATLGVDTSTQVADGEKTITATVKDSNGAVIANTPVQFTSTGGSSPLVIKNTDEKGVAQAQYKENTITSYTITAKTQLNSSDAGKSVTVNFVEPVNIVLHSVPSSRNFDKDSGFPKTGYSGAEFQIYPEGNSTHVKDYSWSSNQSWVNVNSSGIVSLSTMPNSGNSNVKITGKSTVGGLDISYSFTVKDWIIFTDQISSTQSSDVQVPVQVCANQGYELPSGSLMSGSAGTVGTVYGEWSLSDFPKNSSYNAGWLNDMNSSTMRMAVVYANGTITNVVNNTINIICHKFI